MITIQKIKKTLESKLDIKCLSIESRKRHIVYGRFVGFKLCSELTENGLTEIALEFGKVNHGTVINGLNQFDTFKNQPFFKQYLEIYMDLFKLFEPKKSVESLKLCLDNAINDILWEKQKNPEIDYSFLAKSINDLTLVND
ncbi:MAG: hypothetical protein ACJA2M_000287 [Polaribacter sp.]|jgi:hypothetical protein